jgi:hypothetical protein
VAIDPNTSTNLGFPGQNGPPGAPNTASPPAMMALPANVPLAADASEKRKFYTITANLREVYDSNVNTASTDPQASLETDLSPSILVDFPTENSDFSARYTLGLTYYSQNNSNGQNSNGPSLDVTHEVVGQYQHSFSSRFSLNLAEDFRYYTEPSLLESTGTVFRNGPYVSNTVNGNFTAQWTPLIGATTTYANTIVRYQDANTAQGEDSNENTGSQNVSFAILPKISLSFGGIVDIISYKGAERGYSSYTGFVGAQWQALPSLSVSARGGGTETQTNQSQSTLSPYGAVSIDWTLGARSLLSFDYAHEVTPTDEIGADGQQSDRFSSTFSYEVTTKATVHLQGVFTRSEVPETLIAQTGMSSYSENDYYLDTGVSYQLINHFDLQLGVTLSGVSSGVPGREYTRQQFYAGVTGTY